MPQKTSCQNLFWHQRVIQTAVCWTMLNSELWCCTVALRNYTSLLHALTSNNALYFIRCTVVLQNPILKLRYRGIWTTVSLKNLSVALKEVATSSPKILRGTDLFDFSWTKRFRNLRHSYSVRPPLLAIRTAKESALRHCTCNFMKMSDSPKEKKRFKSVSVFLEKAWWHLPLQKHLFNKTQNVKSRVKLSFLFFYFHLPWRKPFEAMRSCFSGNKFGRQDASPTACPKISINKILTLFEC